ncbi:uncharacterized protein LOC125239984 isoform X3 [Leguminivora glycinivorella]|uniref:uncharacterized protein LOC125239984 isoform X3 n=1 Tax=Leguminivora glycinivorella TaxID=1035111 RepID=UPI00200E84DA|nr:uncharacterized protein LOC125239984 isoform X3 [Leguminivora glycinivorella]
MESINQCHCCLQRPPAKYLRTPYTRHGITEIYSLMIEECFVIKLTLGNDDQSGICEECLRLLREASSFKMQVLRCQTELRERLEAELRVKEEKMDEPLEDDLCSEFAEPSLPSDEVSLDQPIKEEPRDEYMSPPDKESPPCKEEPRDEYMSPPDEVSPGPPCEEEPRDEYMSLEVEVEFAPREVSDRRDGADEDRDTEGCSDEATTSTSTSTGQGRKTAQYYRDHKQTQLKKESLTTIPSTNSSAINIVETSKKRKSAAQYQKEYRARKKAQRNRLIWTGGCSMNQPTAGLASDIGFAKPTRKTPAEYQREYRARKKAKRESMRAAENGSMEIADG